MVVTGSADMATDFMGVLGYKTITVTSSATAKWGSTRLRVALVLDNTGSMAQSGKITALKTATTNLLTQLQNAVTNDGDVYVSIVPFSKNVTVNAANNVQRELDRLDRLGPRHRRTQCRDRMSGRVRPAPTATTITASSARTGRRTAAQTTSTIPCERHLRRIHLPEHRQRQQEFAQRQHLLQRLLQQRRDHDHDDHNGEQRAKRKLQRLQQLHLHRQRLQQGLQADRYVGRRALYAHLDRQRHQHLERLPHRSRHILRRRASSNYDQTVVAPPSTAMHPACIRPSSIPTARCRRWG